MNNFIISSIIMAIALFLQAYIQCFILNILFNIKMTNKDKCFYSLAHGILSTTFKMVAPISIYMLNPLFFILLSTTALFLLKKSTFFKGIIYSMTLLLLSIPVEIIGELVLYKLFNMPNDTDNVIAAIPILIFIILGNAILAIGLYLFKKYKNVIFHFDNKFIGLNIFIVFLILAPNIMFYATNRYNYPFWLLLYNVLSNITLVILTIYNTYRNIKLEITKRDLQNSEMHNKTLNELVDSIRIFKHDYNNVVHAIGGYIDTNDIEGLKDYYKGLVKDSKKVNQLESISPCKINEPSIYGLLASKYQTAESKYIEFSFESMIDYRNINMPVYEFCKILGILLDNAIEAANECDDKKIIVVVRESKKTGIQMISIKNTYLNKDIDVNKVFEKNYSTKNRNSGLGLWEVKNIIDRNKNVSIVTSKDDLYFKQELYIKCSNS